MERKHLLVNGYNIKPFFTWKFKAYFAFFYLLLFVPIVMNFVYLFIIGLRLEKFVDTINKTKVLEYLTKTEKIVDYVCNNENIC